MPSIFELCKSNLLNLVCGRLSAFHVLSQNFDKNNDGFDSKLHKSSQMITVERIEQRVHPYGSLQLPWRRVVPNAERTK